jgi:AraC-like DNA-binding protein
MPAPNDRTTDPSPPAFFSAQVRTARRFYLDLKTSQKPLSVVCGGCEDCARDYAIHRDDFPYYSLEFVARGQGSISLRGRRSVLRSGRLFCYGPGIPHDITTDPVEPLVKYFIDFTGTAVRGLLREYQLDPGEIVQVSAAAEVQVVFDELIVCGLRSGPYTALLCARLLEYLLIKVASLRVPLGAVETRAYATFHHCRQHIEVNFLRLRTLAEAAKACHVDAAYLCRLFQRYGHQSPYQFLLRLKMNRAAERLQSPSVLVKQVADELGFSDAFHFSRSFKHIFGISPEAFRKLR